MLQVIKITEYAQGDGLYSGGKVVVMSYVKFPAQDINLVRRLENNQEDVNQAFFLIYTLGFIHIFTCHKGGERMLRTELFQKKTSPRNTYLAKFARSGREDCCLDLNISNTIENQYV